MHSRIQDLPNEIQINILNKLDVRSAQTLWFKSSSFKTFSLFSGQQDQASTNALFATNKQFKNLLEPAHLSAMGDKLAKQVVNGNQEDLVKSLSCFPELIHLRLSFHDLSGRFFEDVTIYQYAHWALDRHLWQAIDQVITEPSLQQEMDKQLIELQNEGVHYRYNDQAYTESNYDLDQIINALNDYINQRDGFSLDERVKNWVKKIGKIQIGFPVHIVNEFCQATKFEPTPDFKSQALQRKSKFYFKVNANKGDQYDWYARNDQYEVGKNFAILKTLEGATALAAPTKTLDIIALKTNMDVLRRLKKVRLEERALRIAERPFTHPDSSAAPQQSLRA